nr:AraC family transcriptional regulator [uncultured Rhodopila sp.]
MAPAAGTWQRVGPLSALPSVLRDFGVDPAPILLASGLSPDSLDDSEALIPYAAMGRVCEAAVRLGKVPLIGLLVGQRARSGGLGVVGRLMQTAPTLEDAIVDLVSNHQRYVRGGVPVFLNSADPAILTYTIYDEDVVAIDQIFDGMLAAACAIFRELAGESPVEVRIAHRSPDDAGAYRRFFGAPVVFDSEQSVLVYQRSQLAAPVRGADPAAREHLLREVDAYWRIKEPDLVDRVNRLLAAGTMGGAPGAKDVARRLSMHPRTLDRRLRERGLLFRDLSAKARFHLARQLLMETGMSVTAIGLALGYADISVFSRAFVRWSGLPPSEWRVRRSVAPDDVPVKVAAE